MFCFPGAMVRMGLWVECSHGFQALCLPSCHFLLPVFALPWESGCIEFCALDLLWFQVYPLET